MSGMSSYLENQVMSHIFEHGHLPKPNNIAIALCTSSPNKSNTGATIPEVLNEPGNNYSRQVINPGDINWNLGLAGLVTNKNFISFPMAKKTWGTITDIAIIDDGNYGEGNMLFFGALLVPIPALAGYIVRFQPNQIQIKPDGC
jgi:hypothetical protein